jgi:UDPglucose 6-dehydrogenase
MSTKRLFRKIKILWNYMMKIGIIGVGFVGSAILASLTQKGYVVTSYDKYKKIGSIDTVLDTEILFVALPTLYDTDTRQYDISGIRENLEILSTKKYSGLVVIKSTVEPNTTKMLLSEYQLDIVHNPEFLTARTALHDFDNQKHIVLGVDNPHSNVSKLIKLYETSYPLAKISVCNTTESELMKLALNSFYAVKVQFFTELYCLCDKLNVNYNNVKTLMLENGWITPTHTQVPGPDGQLSYGGMCFPKDTNALSSFMDRLGCPCTVLKATILERNHMRTD